MGTLREIWLRHPRWQRCVYCGHEARTQDHIRPRNRGGTDDPWNLAPACGPCNSGKGSKLLTEWDAVRVGRAARVNWRVRVEWETLVTLQRTAPLVDMPGRGSAGPRPARSSRHLLLQLSTPSGRHILGHAARAAAQTSWVDLEHFHGGPFHPGDPFGFMLHWLWQEDLLAGRGRDYGCAIRFLVDYMLYLNDENEGRRRVSLDELIDGLDWAWPYRHDDPTKAGYPEFAEVARVEALKLLSWEMWL